MLLGIISIDGLFLTVILINLFSGAANFVKDLDVANWIKPGSFKPRTLAPANYQACQQTDL